MSRVENLLLFFHIDLKMLRYEEGEQTKFSNVVTFSNCETPSFLTGDGKEHTVQGEVCV